MTTTKTRLTQAQRETLQELLRAAAKAKAAAAALKTAKDELENAERAAFEIVEAEPQTIKDENGILRTICVSLSKSYTAAGTAAQRVSFAKQHGLSISQPDCSTAALKTVASEAMAAGILIPVPKIVID